MGDTAREHLLQALGKLAEARDAAEKEEDTDLVWALNNAAARTLESLGWIDQIAASLRASLEEKARRAAENN